LTNFAKTCLCASKNELLQLVSWEQYIVGGVQVNTISSSFSKPMDFLRTSFLLCASTRPFQLPNSHSRETITTDLLFVSTP